MRRERGRFLGSVTVLGALLLGARGVAAQAGSQNACQYAARYSNIQGTMVFLSGPVQFKCADGVRARADSVINVRDLGEYYMIGHVFYTDTLKSMTADWVHYQSVQQTLQARGHVVVTDLKSGSNVRGQQLVYFRAMPKVPGRAETRVVVQGGRPHAVLFGQGAGGPQLLGAPAGGNGTADTTRTIVDADMIELDGQNRFHATGNVVLRRGSLRGYGEEASFDQTTNELNLVSHARVVGDRYTLTAAHIKGHLDAHNRLDAVHATGAAVLTAEQATVRAPDLRIQMQDGEVRRLIALGGRRLPKATKADTTQAVANSQDIRLVADSIDGYGSAQRMDSLYAVGTAYGEQFSDTVRTDLPALLRSDWARGDTIRAYFTEIADTVRRPAAAEPPSGAAPAATDSIGKRAVLDHLVIIGSKSAPAQTVYRSRKSGQPASAKPSINYMVATSFVIRMDHGQVQGVQATGPVHGVHLDPMGRDTTKADTTKADTTKADTTKADTAGSAGAAVYRRVARPGSGGGPKHGRTSARSQRAARGEKLAGFRDVELPR